MYTLEPALQRLITSIEQLNYQVGDSIDFVELLNPSEKELTQIRKEVKGEDLEYIDEFWDLQEILFRELVIKGFKNRVLAFFTKAHQDKFDYQNPNDPNRIKAVDIMYSFRYSDEFFLCIEPCGVFYNDSKAKRLNVDMEYDVKELEAQLEKLLDFLGINYADWKEDTDDAYILEWEIEPGDDFCDFISECWNEAKKKTDSELVGLMFYASGGSIFDVETLEFTGDSEPEIIDYLARKDIFIKSELDETDQ